MRKILLFTLALMSILTGFKLDAQEKQNPVCISLGRWCVPALFLKFHHLREESYPFDWLITGNLFSDLYNVLQDDFTNFGLKENLILEPHDHKFVFDTKTGFWFAHDFPVIDHNSYHIVDNFLDFYDEVRAKYQRRIERFRETLRSDRMVIFIRFDVEEEGTPDQALSLRDLLISQYPTLNFVCIHLAYREEYKTAWNFDRIYNFYIDESTATQYNSPEWRKVLSAIMEISLRYKEEP